MGEKEPLDDSIQGFDSVQYFSKNKKRKLVPDSRHQKHRIVVWVCKN